ncbi:MAG: RhuM family protein [Paludibacter sp.]|nr:RhuM family protein [Paludibacter sp.]
MQQLLDGKTYQVEYFNLDVIISVGYRVKSKRGTQFRIRANRILKEYLLNGHVVNQRFDRLERKILEHDQKFDLLIKTSMPPNEGIF